VAKWRRSECSLRGSDEKVEAWEPKYVRQMTLAEFDQLFPGINSCKGYLMERRWSNVPRRREREGLLNMRRTHPYRFSVYVGTVVGNITYSFRAWFQVLIPNADFQERDQRSSKPVRSPNWPKRPTSPLVVRGSPEARIDRFRQFRSHTNAYGVFGTATPLRKP